MQEGGQDIALGLFNRAHHRLHLHETGAPAWNRLTVEHNGLLLRTGAEPILPRALAHASRYGSLTLSGIDDMHRRAVPGIVEARKIAEAPAIPLGALAAGGDGLLATLSANARAQLRRALRLYGPGLAIEPATTEAEALSYLARLVPLHRAAWAARGQPGAFEDPAILSFHEALIRTGFARGEIQLSRIATRDRELGYLYNFQHGGRVLSYQSGFAAEIDPRLKPGLVCHLLAIGQARDAGYAIYDFLAGAQRYKTTLAPHYSETLHWVTAHRPGSVAAYYSRFKGVIRRLKSPGARPVDAAGNKVSRPRQT